MKQRFSDLRQRVLSQASKPTTGQDIDAATKRIDMEERVAVERMKLKRTRHEQAMAVLGKQLEQQEGSLDGDAKVRVRVRVRVRVWVWVWGEGKQLEVRVGRAARAAGRQLERRRQGSLTLTLTLP